MTACVDALSIATDDEVVVRVEVENDGSRACTELLRLQLHDPIADLSRPTSEHVEWTHMRLEPGERRAVELAVRASAFG